MRKNILILLMSISLCGISQSISVTWSNAFKPVNGMIPKLMLGEFNNELYVLKENPLGDNMHLFLETYSTTDMAMTNSVMLEMPHVEEKGNTDFIDLYMVNGKLMLFFKLSSGGNYADSKYKCYGTIIDKEGKTTGDPILLYEEVIPFEYRGVGSGKRNTEYQWHSFKTLINSDSSSFFLYTNNLANGKLNGKVIGTNFQTISTQALDLPFTKSVILSNFIMDENNILYLTSKEGTDNEAKFNYKVISFDLKNKTSKSKTIPAKNAFPVTDLYMSKHKAKLQLVTYYYDAVKTNVSSGGNVFYEFDAKDLELKNTFEKPFDETTISQLNSNSNYLKAHYENNNAINILTSSKIINLPNDETVIISEQYIQPNIYGYHYFNILVSRVNKTGIQSNPAVIPKAQSGTARSYYSYLDMVKGNQLFLIYNDHIKNVDNPNPYKTKACTNFLNSSIPMLVTVNEKGEWSKKPFWKVDESTAYIYPALPYRKKSGEVILFGKVENKIRFVTLKP
jgi:hypothetical protein